MSIYLKGNDNMNISNTVYPAYPLITCDPSLNVWSMSRELNTDAPRHWTGFNHPMTGIIKVDGNPKLFMGKIEHNPNYHMHHQTLEKINQTDITVTPLKTTYIFRDEKIELEVCFMTPLLPDDLKIMSRPVSYISYDVKTVDGNMHDIVVYIDVSALFAVDTPDGEVTLNKDGQIVSASSGDADMLKESGDDKRISWGTLYFTSKTGKTGITYDNQKMWSHNHKDDLTGKTLRVMDKYPALYSLHEYEGVKTASGYVCIGYDDIYSLDYYGEKIPGYWKRDGEAFGDVFSAALDEFESLSLRADEFDRELMEKAAEISEDYVKIVSIAYRQAVAAHKLAWTGKEGVFVSKECFSNGCAATVDVTYPSIPLFLIYNPDLVEFMLNPIFELVNRGLWSFEFAPHDAGRYPLVTGQVYGLREGELKLEFQMPVEECGNMLLCVAAICRKKNSTEYAEKHFEILNKWANYLIDFGYDPGNQLCTDDFAGHLAHNCNLSVKAIMGLAAWGMLLKMMGKEDSFTAKAKEFAAKWKKDAFEGDHYRLAFDKEESWSIKYNLVWDKLLGLGIFDEDVFTTEVEYYKTRINKYGLPLDCRSLYTKSDWQMWSTVLCDDREYTAMIVSAMLKMLSETPDLVPFTDWYFTDNSRQRSFQNRTVQGGLFINMLNFD